MKKLSFSVPVSAALVTPEGKETLSIRWEGEKGGLTVRVRTSYSNEPLILTAQGLPAGAQATVLMHPHRIELWANGRLFDEEWPYGALPAEDMLGALFASGISVEEIPDADDDANMPLRGEDWASQCGVSANETSPCVIGRLLSGKGENAAEGWRPEGDGVFVGDCMPYADTGSDGVERYHVLYLKDRRHHHSKWGKGAHQWAHISTRDMKNWELHPLAVSIDEPWEGSICTGSWLKAADGTQYLYYTIRTMDADSAAPILRSVSRDGFHFRRDPVFRLELKDGYHANSARDPKVVKASDGWHMFVTTSLMEKGRLGRGCLAHLYSCDGEDWTYRAPIYVSDTLDQPECPDYFEKDGWYYLIFSLRGRGQYRLSASPFSGWIEPPDPYIPCQSVPKMALWKGQAIFTGFRCFDPDAPYAGTMTFAKAVQMPDGTLRF